uniref:Uncharacterized protein n=1 Tax=Arundo donax TaxID=35708 RepID=A0A0A8YZG2_ARUDO
MNSVPTHALHHQSWENGPLKSKNTKRYSSTYRNVYR